MCMYAQFEEGGGFFDCVVRSVWNAICRDGFFAADSRLIVAVLRSLARRPGKRSVFLIRPKSLALAHAAVELPRFESAGGTRRFSEGNSDRGTPPSLPPWGRWQPEGLTDEVVYRNPPPLLIPFVLFAVSHVGTAFCGGFPPDCRHAALTPALLHSASAGFGRRSQMRAPSVRLCRTLQRLAIARLPGDPENVLFSCSGQKLGTRPQRGRGPKFLFGKHAARKGRPSVLLYIACENTTSSVSPTDCHHSMGLPARPH